MTYNVTYKHRLGDVHWEIEDRLDAFYVQRLLCRGNIRNPYLWLAILISQVGYWTLLASTGSVVLAFIFCVSASWWMVSHATDAWAGDIIERLERDNRE